VIRQEHIVGPCAGSGTGPGRRVDAVVRARVDEPAVRKAEELEVVVGVDDLVDVLQHVLERPAFVYPLQHEGLAHLQDDLGDHSQATDADARGSQ
jgi:hypothetical protein